MPTLLRIGPYRFFVYSNENDEPRHVHVQRDRSVAKFWLEPVVLERNSGFPDHELKKIEQLVVEHRQTLIERWNEHFNR